MPDETEYEVTVQTTTTWKVTVKAVGREVAGVLGRDVIEQLDVLHGDLGDRYLVSEHGPYVTEVWEVTR